MKYIYKSICLAAFALVSLSIHAQKDTTLTRQVMLEREYAPTLKDASRINKSANIYEHQVKPSSAKFVSQAPVLSLVHNQLGVVGSGDIGNIIEQNNKRGYFQIAAGNYSNIDMIAGYKIIDTKTDELNVIVGYDATSGKIKYEEKDFSLKKAKAKQSDINANIRYKHNFEPSVLSVRASYLRAGYNYYGNNYLSALITPENLPFDYNSKQATDVFNFSTGLQSSKENKGLLKYDANIGYTYFSNKYGLSSATDGMAGGIFQLDGDVSTELSSDSYVGARMLVLNQSYNNSPQYMKDLLHGYTNITLNPYFRFDGLTWNVEFGANISSLFDENDKFFISPNIKANLHINDVNTLYANITGGINDNTFVDILAENRYATPLGRVAFSKTQYDLQVGFKSGIVQGLEFDIFGGYKDTKADHMYVASGSTSLINMDWSNYGIPVYADVSTGHFGAMATTTLIPRVTLSAKVIGYFYNMKKVNMKDLTGGEDTGKTPWGSPTYTIDLNADIKILEPMTLSGSYQLAGGRKSFKFGKLNNMNAINELNAKLDYQIFDWLTVNARANNLLNQKYELVPGYTLQGMNVLGGVNLKF